MEGIGSSPETIDVAGPAILPNQPVPEQPTTAQRKAGKRDRVALACQRCKTRKQKCDGQRPSCQSCARLSLKCVYIVPLVPAAGEKKLYIKALEQRVAELESVLASLGHLGSGNDHLRGSIAALSSSSSQQTISTTPPSLSSLQACQDAEDDGNDILLAVRDLSLSASGHYVGASSNITIGRVLSSMVHSQRGRRLITSDDPTRDEDDPAPKSVYSTGMGEVLGAPFMTPSVANRLLEGWFRHIATRYPVLHSAHVLELHNNRDNLTDPYDQGILHLVYAVAGRWLESAGEMGHFFSDQHYDVAFQFMDDILPLRDSRTVDYLLLMALYCTRAPRDPGAWTYVGSAMRLCIELGLHRRTRRQMPSVQGEMSKRRFWTAYFLDRDISIAIGRPPGISDHDIDTDLPLDISEDTNSDEYVRQASSHVMNIPTTPSNSLTSFIHRLRLKRIESEIQHVVYRVDQPSKIPDVIVNAFLDRLDNWKNAIPLEARNFVHKPNTAYDGLEFYTIHYHRCVRFLLYPQLDENPINMQYLRLCADACSGIITDYRSLHQVFPVGFSALSIQSVFLAGLTLIYCAWLAPPHYLSVENSLTDCQLLLYIVTERYPSARKYRDVFERIKRTILDLIAQGKHEPRNPVSLEPPVQESFANLSGHWGQGMGADFSYMLGQMTGNVASTPPFDLVMDPTAPSIMGTNIQQAADMGQYQLWPGMPQVPDGMDSMSGAYQ
ncbi:fungal-specific transcription factor domain-containing protein [Pseudomassariella vexata]|uniref:Fungal-specific transcription factor domain-domain-containing protein n=1 Tax=Pseudomassariella vexata TaxID=1141098 RepID=A0A1Y2E3D7_9PEZI|nr:fungal-specific transcription factor domain-containing protein [Pseudomassariella vexata]ORY66068.1 fungal-specific transcription factor domain-domain-containing protein [Pseudomassariella vexata]